jgi:hypothetical protein
MRRFLPLLACFSLTTFALSTAHGEFDASGSQAGPVQIQANRPRAVLVIKGDLMLKLKAMVAQFPPAKPNPAPVKKPVPKPRQTPRGSNGEDFGARD